MTAPGQLNSTPPFSPQVNYLQSPVSGRPGEFSTDDDEFRIVRSLVSNAQIAYGAVVVFDPTQGPPQVTTMQDQSLFVPCALPSTAVQITGANAVQTITPSGTPASGTVVFNFGGVASAAINWNDSQSTIQTKLQAMASLGTNVTVVGTLATTVVVTFANNLGFSNVPLITFTSNSLQTSVPAAITLANVTTTTGAMPLVLGVAGFTLAKESDYDTNPPGTPGTFGVNGLARGVVFVVVEKQNTSKTANVYVRYSAGAAASEIQNLQFQIPAGTEVVPDAGGSFVLGFNNQYTPSIKLTGTAATDAAAIQTALTALANIGAGNLIVATDGSGGFNITFQGTLANLPQSFIKVLYSTVTSGSLAAFPVVAQTTQGTPGAPVGSISNTSDSGKNALLPSNYLVELGISGFNPNTLQWISGLRINTIK